MKLQGWPICQAIIVVFALGGHAAGQTQKSKQTPKQSATRQDFSLWVSKKDVLSVSLKAKGAPLADVAAALSKRLEIPVILGQSAAKREVTTNFTGLLLEPAMHLLAPEVYIDYEINPAPGVQMRPVGIYLNGYDDLQPAINAVIPNKSDVMLVEGNTEDGQEDSSAAAQNENPLRVFYEGYRLSVKARQQPLMVVLAKIAAELGIPLEFKAERHRNSEPRPLPLHQCGGLFARLVSGG